MRVSVNYFGHLRDEFGKGEVFDLFSDSRPHLLSEILNELSRRKGVVFSRTIYRSDGGLNPHITVILNGKVVLDQRTKVKKDCSISLIPFVDGG
jgi:molybdopterin converting factor small subunit